MKVRVCKCDQCSASKRRVKSKNLKRRIKILCNRKRRRDLEDTEYFNYYWA